MPNDNHLARKPRHTRKQHTCESLSSPVTYSICLLMLIMLAACAPPAAPHRSISPAPRRLVASSPSSLSPYSAWRWTRTGAEPFTSTHTLQLPARPDEIVADIRGNGHPLVAHRDAAGVVTVHEGSDPNAPIVWRNEADTWTIPRIDAGDPNDDGRIEYLLLLWKPDKQGIIRSHPFIMGWRGGHYRIIWGGSATRLPIQDCAIGDLDHDGQTELVVLEGGERPGVTGTHISVWHWHGWGFQREWQSAPGHWHSIVLHDSDNDGAEEIYAQR